MIARQAWGRQALLGRCLRPNSSSTTSSATVPSVLLKMRSDLKTAMKTKDIHRLNVLRGLLAETTNASKTSNPIKTDVQLLSLLRKRAAASKSAAEEFSVANRVDLRDIELSQLAVLEEYASGIETVGKEEIKEVVFKVISKMRTEGHEVNTGAALKALVGPNGEFNGKPVENAEVAKIVKGML